MIYPFQHKCSPKSAVMQSYAISLLIKFIFIANIVIVPCFHPTASLTAWYEKRIKNFISTWNQIRVSLATTGKPTPIYKGKHKFMNFNWISALITHKKWSDLHEVTVIDKHSLI